MKVRKVIWKGVVSSVFLLLLTGCQNFFIQPGDLSPVVIEGGPKKPATLYVKTGEALYGSSPSMVLIVGATPTFIAGSANPKRGFGSQDQIEFGKHLAKELERNNVFSSVAFDSPSKDGYRINLDFERTIQYQDMARYDFYLKMAIFSGSKTEFEKRYVVKGQYGMKEYLSGTTIRAGKAREANKLMALLVADIQQWAHNK